MVHSSFRSIRSIATLSLTLGAAYFAATGIVGCGDEAANNKDYGSPPDAAIFNPNPNVGPGDGYGSGGNTGGPAVCPEDFKACPQVFTYPAGTETSVELQIGRAHV